MCGCGQPCGFKENMSVENEWLWWIAQIIVDGILLAAVFILAARLRRDHAPLNNQAHVAVRDFVEQAGVLAREFDRLLGEKRELVGTTLAALDAKISEMQAMLEQTRDMMKTQAASVPKFTSAPAKGSDLFNLPADHPVFRATEAVPASAAQVKNAPAEEAGGYQDFRGEVIKLYNSGKNPQDIALSTGRPRAEVELVIALIK
jgi:ABC-type transporter Mla subunit MlaD